MFSQEASLKNVSQIVSMYENVGIQDVEQVLGKNYPRSFGNHGGMFHIHNEQEIIEMINDKDILFSVLPFSNQENEEKDEIIACISTYKNIQIPDGSILDFKNLPHYYDTWEKFFRKSLEKNKVAMLHDILVNSDFQGYNLSYRVAFEMFNTLIECGKHFATLEIYTVTKVIKNGKVSEITVVNTPSKMHCKNLGMKLVGSVGKKIIKKVGESEIHIQSDVYALNLAEGFWNARYKIQKTAKHIDYVWHNNRPLV